MLYIKVLCIICLTIISDNNGYTMEYNETPAPQINNNNKSMNDLANENIELHKRLDLLYEQMEQIQQERKQEKEDKKCEEELKRILKSKEMLPKHEYKLWKPARRLPWEECEPDPMVWQHLLTILNREINEIQEVGRYFYRTFLFINEDMGYYNWYLSYRNPISSDVTNCEEKFKKFDEHLQKILQNIPENNNKYTNLKDKVLQLIKINNEAIKTTNKYRKLYNQNIFDEEINNVVIAINKMLHKMKIIKDNKRTTLEKFCSIDKTLKQCCDDINEKMERNSR